jgi:hypothetical protein
MNLPTLKRNSTVELVGQGRFKVAIDESTSEYVFYQGKYRVRKKYPEADKMLQANMIKIIQ